MANCDPALLISEERVDEQGKRGRVISPFSLNPNNSESLKVGETETITTRQIAEAFAALPPEQRRDLTMKIMNSTDITVGTKFINAIKDTNYRLVSNTTLENLVHKYSGLADIYEDVKDIASSYTIIEGLKVHLNGTEYTGRVQTASQSLYILSDRNSVYKFFRYLQAQKAIQTAFADEENVPEEFKEYLPDLQKIQKRYHRQSVYDVLLEYLDHQDKALATFRADNRVISPKQILSKVIAKITDTVNRAERFTDLELDIEASNILREKEGNFDIAIPKNNLYSILSIHIPTLAERISQHQFYALTSEELNDLFYGSNGLFLGHPKLSRYRVSKAAATKVESAEPEEVTYKEKRKAVSQEKMKIFWKKLNEQLKTINPEIELPTKMKDVQQYWADHAEELSQLLKLPEIKQILKQEVDPIAKIEVIKTVDKNNNPVIRFDKVTMEAPAPKVEGQVGVITFVSDFMTVGDLYGVSYKTPSIFAFAHNPDLGVVNGRYQGFFVYQTQILNPETGTMMPVFAASRSLMSPASRPTYSATLEGLLPTLQDKNTYAVIGKNGLITMKQVQEGVIPRTSYLEMEHVSPGQIVSALNIKLPNIKIKDLNETAKAAFNMKLGQFHDKFKQINNIKSLDTPEKAAAFLMLSYKAITDNESNFKTFTWDTLFKTKYLDTVQQIITDINSASMSHYMIETIYDNDAVLKLLRYGGTDIDEVTSKVGDFSIQDFLDLTFDRAIDHFKNKYNIEVEVLTQAELEELNAQTHLLGDAEVDGVKAFVRNGKIYFNKSNAEASDLYHEVAHIFLGALRVNDMDAYLKVLEGASKMQSFKRVYNSKKYSARYQNMAHYDLMEETAAELIGLRLFKNQGLSLDGFQDGIFDNFIKDIFKTVQQFTELPMDNGLGGFHSLMASLIQDSTKTDQDNMSKIMRQNQIAHLIQQKISEGKIIEDCK